MISIICIIILTRIIKQIMVKITKEGVGKMLKGKEKNSKKVKNLLKKV